MNRITKIIILAVLLAITTKIVLAQTFEADIPPPVVTHYNKQMGNDEIFYIGGTGLAPKAVVTIFLQKSNGSIISEETLVNKDGEWFYSHKELLSPGKYAVWTQMKFNDLTSPPSGLIEFEVTATALQIGNIRFNKEQLYFFLTLFFMIIALILTGFIIYHYHQHRVKSAAFDAIQSRKL